MQRTSIETALRLTLETIATHHPALAQQIAARFEVEAAQSTDAQLRADLQAMLATLRSA